jgi:hypothetical protein
MACIESLQEVGWHPSWRAQVTCLPLATVERLNGDDISALGTWDARDRSSPIGSRGTSKHVVGPATVAWLSSICNRYSGSLSELRRNWLSSIWYHPRVEESTGSP